jgi:ABC-type multidrug transport system fused ATPase/permease subunit
MTSSAAPNDDPDTSNDDHHPRRSGSSSMQKKKKNNQMMHRLLRHELYLESAYLLLGGTTMMISSYCNQLFPRALGRYIDQRSSSTRSDTNHHKSSSSSDPNNGWYIPFGMIVLLGGLASGLRTLSLQLAAHRIASRLKQYLYAALLLPSPPPKNNNDNDDDDNKPPPTTITTTTTNDHTAATASSSSSSSSSSLSPSYVTSILTTDVEQISQMVTSQLVNTLRSASATLFSLYHMLRISPRLVLTTITIIPTLGIGTLILNRYLKRAQPSPQAAMEYVEERLTHTPLIHQYDRARDEIQAHQQQLVREYQQYGLPAALLNGARMTFLFWSGSGTLLYVLHCGTTTTTTTRGTPLSGGQLTSFTSYALLFGLGCSGLLKSHQERHAILTGALQRYESVWLGRCGEEEETMILPTTQSSTQPDPVEPPNDDQSLSLVEAVTSIDIRDVSFAYPPRHDHSDDATIAAIDNNNNESKNDNFVLRNISLTIPKGRVVALVGPNGAGKSTLVHLLLGHDRPTTGSIHAVVAADTNETTHHVPYHQTWSPRVQNQLVQVVPQATSLLNMSIYDNVQYSNKYATHRDVMTALQDADCYPWKTSTHQGGDDDQTIDDDDEKLLRQTKVGKNGSLLSGGERQKIGLARALLNNPHFLVLDEPTTHIDQNSNTKIANRIVRRRHCQEQSGDKRGILLITHDVKTILEYQVDYVYVMKQGQIVEHNTLEFLQCDRQSELCQLMPKLYHPATD